MEADIKIDHSLNAAGLNRRPVAPFFIRADHLAELGTPVAQMVDAHRGIAIEVINALQAVPDHRCGQMADVEPLCDIDGGIVNADRLPCPKIAATPVPICTENGTQDFLRHFLSAEEYIEIAADGLHPAEQRGPLKRSAQLPGNQRRRLAQHPGQSKAGHGIVPQLFIRRNLQHPRNLFLI